jgi:hypothetical protein
MNKVIRIEHIKHGMAYVQFDCYHDSRDVFDATSYAVGHLKPHYPVPAKPMVAATCLHEDMIGLEVIVWSLPYQASEFTD